MMLQNLIIQENTDKQGELIEQKLFNFLKTFQLSTNHEDFMFARENFEEIELKYDYFYIKQAQLIKSESKTCMLINMSHLNEYDIRNELRDAILMEYSRFERHINEAVNRLMKELFPDWIKNRSFTAAFYNLGSYETMRDLKSVKIGKLARACKRSI
jgi:DNA replicative helicase MCM subunit Mcm2 (Cdc46/Mcm family)